MWHDSFLGVINWILVVSLLPTVFSKTQKPVFLSSVLIGSCLVGISFTYYSLALYMSALPAGLNALQFFVLAYQRWRINNKTGEPLFVFWK